jgi:hypothetical protein
MNYNWRPGGTILWIWMCDWLGNPNEALVAFVPPMLIEDRPLHWTLVKSQTYYPEHILTYGSGNAHYSLIVGSGSFRTD